MAWALRKNGPALAMDRAYEDVETRQLATDLDFMPGAPEEQPRRSLGIRPEIYSPPVGGE